MTGSEVRKVLQENRINFALLAKELGISPQGLNSRLLAKEFRQSYLLELNQVLGKPLFEVPTAINEYRLPVYQIQISAGYGMPLDEGKESVTEYVQIPNLKGCIGVTVFGDSMYPLYYPSDIVFVRRVMDKQDINYGSAYVIITTSERLLKLLYPSTRGDEYIRLCSYNAALKPERADIKRGMHHVHPSLFHVPCVLFLRHVVQFHAHRVPDGCKRVKTDTVTSHLNPRNVATL